MFVARECKKIDRVIHMPNGLCCSLGDGSDGFPATPGCAQSVERATSKDCPPTLSRTVRSSIAAPPPLGPKAHRDRFLSKPGARSLPPQRCAAGYAFSLGVNTLSKVQFSPPGTLRDARRPTAISKQQRFPHTSSRPCPANRLECRCDAWAEWRKLSDGFAMMSLCSSLCGRRIRRDRRAMVAGAGATAP